MIDQSREAVKPSPPANPLWYGCGYCRMRTPEADAAARAYQPCPHCRHYDWLSDKEYIALFPIHHESAIVFLPLDPSDPSAYDEQVPEPDGDPLRWPLEPKSRRRDAG